MEREWKDVAYISQLKTGDIVRHKAGGEAYVVTGQYGSRATAVRTVDITHDNEWERLDQSPLPTSGDSHG